MRAQLCRDFSGLDAMRLEETALRDPGPGEVVVQVSAAGVNFPDSLFVTGKYQVQLPLPFSPGIEVAGTVKAIGPGVDDLRLGDRVAAHPLWGGFAEEVLVARNRVFALPAAVDEITAAGFLITYGTSYNALKRGARLQPGETLLVLGASGGVGLAAVELGVAMGARVIAAASTDEKLALCREHGAHEVLNYSGPDTEQIRARLRELTGGRGPDVVCDPIGGDLAEPMLRSVAPEGRYLVVGFAAGSIPRIPLNLPLLKLVTIVGVHWGPWLDRNPEATAIDMAELMEMAAAKQITPHVSETYPLQDAAEAVRRVAGRKTLGKVVLTTAR